MRVTRRGLISGCASLAVGLGGRKSRAQEGEIGQLQLRDPPRAVAAEVHWTDAGGLRHGVAEYAGRGLVLNFWATWCAPCVAEMPSLVVLGQRVAAAGVVVVPVAGDAAGAPAVAQFFARYHITGLGVWLDPRGAAAEAIGAVGLPTTLIIDRRGREVARVAGAADWAASGTAETVVALCNAQWG